MNVDNDSWVLLIYKIPPHPTRLRLQIWRRLQRLGALYLQDAVCILPARPDLVENMQYVAETIAEMNGTYHLFSADTLFPEDSKRIQSDFQLLASARFDEIDSSLSSIELGLEDGSPQRLERGDEEFRRERTAYLKARKIAYFGAENESSVEGHLDELQHALEQSPHRK